MIYTPGKDFFAAAAFKGLLDVFLDRVEKFVVYTLFLYKNQEILFEPGCS